MIRRREDYSIPADGYVLRGMILRPPCERVSPRGFAPFAASLLLGLFFVHPAALAQGTRITGQVRVGTGQEENGGATVELYNSNQMLADRTVTDTRGQFYFLGVSTDEYSVVVYKPGFQTATTRVNVAFNTIEQYVTVFLVPQDEVRPVKPDAKVSAAELALPHRIRQEFEKGKEALRKKKYDAAIRRLAAVTEAAPQFALGHEVLGVAYYRSGDLARAEASFRKAIELDPKRGESFIQLGLLDYERQRYGDSQKSLETGLRLEPESAFAHFQLGLTFFAQEKYSDSEREFRRAQELDSHLTEVHVRLGNVYLRKQNPAQALTEFEKYLRKAPQGPFAARVRQVVSEMRSAGIVPAP